MWTKSFLIPFAAFVKRAGALCAVCLVTLQLVETVACALFGLRVLTKTHCFN